MRRAPAERLVTPLFLLVMASTFSYFVAVGALQPTLPLYIKESLGGGSVGVGLGIGAFSLSAVLIRPVIARYGDSKGRRALMICGAAIVAVSTAGFLAVDSLSLLLLLRLLGGAGEAAFYVGAASVINDLAPDERRGEALSYFSLALFAGLAVGPVIGESVLGADRFWAAWIVAAASAGLGAVLGIWVTDTRPDEIKHAEEPLRGRIIHPAGVLPGFVLAASVWGLGGFTTFVPLYARELGLSGSRFIFVLYSVIVIAIRLLGAQIPDRLGPGRSARYALTLQATGLATMGLWHAPAALFIGAALFATGQALLFPALMTLAVRGAPATERASVVGTFTAFFDIAFGLGAVTLGGVADALGYGGAFVSAGAVALGGLAILLIRARRARDAAGASRAEQTEVSDPGEKAALPTVERSEERT